MTDRQATDAGAGTPHQDLLHRIRLAVTELDDADIHLSGGLAAVRDARRALVELGGVAENEGDDDQA
jgi:hypothetical protein